MPILPIIKYPHPVLRRRAATIAIVDDAVRTLAGNMRDTMLAASGLGLAAPQVGVSIRLIITEIGEPLALVNPRIIASEGAARREEGCLSIPGFVAEVERAGRVTVEALDVHGKTCCIDADGLLAICLQHEIDHLNGVLFIDHLSKLKRERLLAKYRKLRAQENAGTSSCA